MSINFGGLTSPPYLFPHGLSTTTGVHKLVIPSPSGWGLQLPHNYHFHRVSLDPVNLEATAFPDLYRPSLKLAPKLAFLSIRPPMFFRAQGLQSFHGNPLLLLHLPPVFSLLWELAVLEPLGSWLWGLMLYRVRGALCHPYSSCKNNPWGLNVRVVPQVPHRLSSDWLCQLVQW